MLFKIDIGNKDGKAHAEFKGNVGVAAMIAISLIEDRIHKEYWEESEMLKKNNIWGNTDKRIDALTGLIAR